jgi:predicted outer membrane repeat protein
LQDIINGAQEGSVISLDKDYKSTQSSAIKLDKSLTIDGQGYTLDCDNKCGALESNSGQITLKNLIIKNGHKNQGSANFISGSARYTLINCIFKNGDGIAVYNNAEHGSLSITGSEFDGNRLGAVYSKGVVYVEDSEFTSNVATRGGAIDCEAAVYVTYSSFSSNKGDAIFAKGQIFAENSNFTDNTGSDGGAIYGFDYIFLNYCTFKGNKANVGGAIYKTNDGDIVVSHSSFSNNEATGAGGAICTKSQITIENSEFSGNSANGKGGAIYSEYILFEGKSSFSGNHANGHGGAIYTNKIAKNVVGLYFQDNHADSDYGGAIYINSKCGDVNFINCTFLRNYAIAGDGGAIYSDSGSTNLNFYNCTFNNNFANGGETRRFGGAVRSCGNVNVYDSTF